VAYVPNAAFIVLVETIAAAKGVTVTAANFGLKVWKANSTGVVNLTLNYDLIYEPAQNFLIADGASDQCSPNTFNITADASGNGISPTPAYLCVFETGSGDGHSLHLFIPSTGEMRQVGLVTTGYSGDSGDRFYVTSNPACPIPRGTRQIREPFMVSRAPDRTSPALRNGCIAATASHIIRGHLPRRAPMLRMPPLPMGRRSVMAVRTSGGICA
jgi:hypothetical protein